MKKVHSFEKGALLLIITGLIAKALGALYRIPLTNIIGVEGIGLYQMIIPTLLLMLAISSNYIPAVISKCTAYLSFEKGEQENKRIYNSAIKFVLFITILFSLLLFIFSKQIARIQHNENLAFCYVLLIPTIILSGLKNVERGWFFGYKDMLFPSLSQLIEQIIKIISSLSLAYLGLKRGGIVYATIGAVTGLIFGEIFGFLFLLIVRYIKKGPLNAGNYDKRLYYRLLMEESYPIMLSGIVFPIVSFVDSFLIVNLLMSHGLTSSIAIKEYGLLQGPVHSLIHVPIMIATSLSLAIIPMLSSLFSANNAKDIKEKSSMSIKLCLFMVVPAAIGLALISKESIFILYPKMSEIDVQFCSILMISSCVNIVLLSLLEIFTSILQGLSQAQYVAKTILLATLLKILVELIFIKIIGIYGAILSNVVMYLFAVIVLVIKYSKFVGKDAPLIKSVSKICVCSGIMALAISLVTKDINNNVVVVISALIVGIIIYFISAIVLEVFLDKELSKLPLGRQLLKLRHKAW